MSMIDENYYLRNYTPGDEVREIEIYNSVISEQDSSLAYRTVEYIQYRYGSLNYRPEHTLYLVEKSKDEIVGYCAVDMYSEVAIVSYPFIISDHRTKSHQSILFSQVFEFAKNNHSYVISHSYSVTLHSIHDFFEQHGYESKNETRNLQVESTKLNQSAGDYTGVLTHPEKLNDLQDFISNAKAPNLSSLDIEEMKNEFDSNVFSPDRLLGISKRERIIEYSGMSVATYPKNGEKYGYQSFMLFDIDDSESRSIGINRIFLFYPALERENIPYFRMQISVQTPEDRIKPYLDLGFSEFEPNSITYSFND